MRFQKSLKGCACTPSALLGLPAELWLRKSSLRHSATSGPLLLRQQALCSPSPDQFALYIGKLARLNIAARNHHHVKRLCKVPSNRAEDLTNAALNQIAHSGALLKLSRDRDSETTR